MFINTRLSTSSQLRTLIAHPPRPSLSHTAAPRNTRYYSITKEWKGSKPESHEKERAKRGDTHDVHAAAGASGMQEREGNEGVADETKSQGMTERGGVKQERKAKEEHPAAPEPIIGMNDERAQVRVMSLGLFFWFDVVFVVVLTCFCSVEGHLSEILVLLLLSIVCI